MNVDQLSRVEPIDDLRSIIYSGRKRGGSSFNKTYEDGAAMTRSLLQSYLDSPNKRSRRTNEWG